MIATIGTDETVEPVVTAQRPDPRPLGGAMLRGMVWSGGARWLGQLVTWGSTLIVARLLSPSDYGIVAMAMILLGLLDILTDAGLGAALVQVDRFERRQAEATMGATCLVGGAAVALMLAGAPVWAALQGEPRLPPVLWMLSGGVALTAAGAVPFALLQRRLEFGRIARAQVAQGLATAIATMMGAALIGSYWALVAGFLVGKIVFTAFIFAAEPIRPRWPSRDTGVARLMRFGGTLSGERLVHYLRSNVDLALIGARLGDQPLGLYVMGLTLARMPIDKLGSAIIPVAFPVFARLQNDLPELRRYFLGLTVGTCALVFPAAFGLLATAHLLVPTVLGAHWTGAVLPLQIAAFFTPIAFHLAIVCPLLNALGRVDLNFRITLWMALLTVPTVIVGAQWGVVGVAIASGLSLAVVGVGGTLVAWRLIGLPVRQVARTILPIASATAGMIIAVAGADHLMPLTLPPLIRLLAAIASGAIVYFGWAWLLHRSEVAAHFRGLRSAWAAS